MITQKEILDNVRREHALQILGLSKKKTFKGVNR